MPDTPIGSTSCMPVRSSKAAYADIYHCPQHPYTLGLLRSVPRLDEPRAVKLEPIYGQPPDLIHLPSGCSFRPRCGFADARCGTESPPLLDREGEGWMACWQARTADLPTGQKGIARAAASMTKPQFEGEMLPVQEKHPEAVILQVRNVEETSPSPRDCCSVRRGDQGGRRYQPLYPGTGNPGVGRGIRLREDDRRPMHPATGNPHLGRSHFSGQELCQLSESGMRAIRQNIQVNFQDPVQLPEPEVDH